MIRGALPAIVLLLAVSLSAQREYERRMEQARQVNELAALRNLRSEADALRFVEALARSFDVPRRWLPPPLKEELARAELAAAHDPVRRVPDTRIAEIVNQILDEFSAPAVLRLDAAAVRRARLEFAGSNLSILTFPEMFARDGNGPARSSRPVEALYVVFMLALNPCCSRENPPAPTAGNSSSSTTALSRSTAGGGAAAGSKGKSTAGCDRSPALNRPLHPPETRNQKRGTSLTRTAALPPG